jgi:hypothetical protein
MYIIRMISVLDQLSLILLLFADDVVLLSEAPDGLQESLDKLQAYCVKWGLITNINASVDNRANKTSKYKKQ